MRWLLGFLLVLVIIAVGIKMVGGQLPILDFPFGGLWYGPQIEVQQPDLNLP